MASYSAAAFSFQKVRSLRLAEKIVLEVNTKHQASPVTIHERYRQPVPVIPSGLCVGRLARAYLEGE
jgi:hypothetical protein